MLRLRLKGKEVHVVLWTITYELHSIAMTIEVVVLVFEFAWVIDWYLELVLSSPSIDSLVYVIRICVDPW